MRLALISLAKIVGQGMTCLVDYWIWGMGEWNGWLQALSSAVQPRALWLAAHHYELSPTLDPGWAHLLQGLSTSLGVHDDDAKTRRYVLVLHAPQVSPTSPAQIPISQKAVMEQVHQNRTESLQPSDLPPHTTLNTCQHHL